MVPEKRKLMIVGAAIAASFAVAGCAPAGVQNAADYGDSTEPAAQAAPTTGSTSDPVAAADPNSTSDPVAEADPDATAPPGSDDTSEGGELSAAETTDELTGTSVKRMGEVVANEDGFVLYRFDADKNTPAETTCYDDCEKVWPAALTNDGKPKLKGVDEAEVGTVTRKDGTKQLTLKGWPLYTYIGDKKPGEWKGQNVGGKWFVIKPDGAKNLTCLPKVSKPVAPPKDDAESSGSDSGSDYKY